MPPTLAEHEAQPRKRRLPRWCLVVASCCVTALPTSVVWAQQQQPAAAPKAAAPQQPTSQEADVVATVNGVDITRNELGKQCLWHYGEGVLESTVNRQLIVQECERRQVTVSQQEVKDEISRIARDFNLPVDQWLKLLRDERKIGPEEYERDIIWPKLALEKLAKDHLNVTDQELQEAYELQFGPQVQCRLFLCATEDKARKVHALAKANPDDFGNLCKEFSEDVSASAKGMIQPIRRHVGNPELERAAFNLQPGQVSDLFYINKHYVMLMCERHIAARNVPMDEVREQLTTAIRNKKLSDVANTMLKQLQESAVVENVFNDPEKRKAHPGVAAIINDRTMTVRELADECIRRHGQEILEGAISQQILKQALAKAQIEITQADIEAEIARAARAMGRLDSAGQPDVQAWLKLVTAEQGVTYEMYVHDTVWPTVALKKLVIDGVEVTEDDLRKGYEANYGPRVRCLAIVLNNHRRAVEVWEMARANPSKDFFGDLAEQYSVEAQSRTLRGEVPPIQRWGGQPVLEKEAFGLRPGELSGVIQVGDNYVILLCEGHTSPTEIDMVEVRDMLYDDIYEKKLRVAMAATFDQLQSSATVDNYLAGTSTGPKKAPQEQSVSPNPQLATPPGARTVR